MTRYRLIVAMAGALALGAGVFAQDLEVELQAAMQSHDATRDHHRAIEVFRRIADLAERASNDAVAAPALLRLADAHRSLKSPEATRIYEQIIRRYSGQVEAATATAHLSAMRPATTMPPTAQPTSVMPGDGSVADDEPSPWAHVTPSGRFLSRPDWSTGDVLLRDLHTGEVRQLLGVTPPAREAFTENAMVSPDGSQVLYLWWNGRQAPGRWEVRVVSTNGHGDDRRLMSLRDGSYVTPIGWSPDSRQALVLQWSADDGTTQLLWVEVQEDKAKLLKSLGHRDGTGRFSLSPDGKYVAYSLLTEPKKQNAQGRWIAPTTHQHIYVLPTDGSGTDIPVVTGANVNESPVWTPDGTHLVFVSNRGADGRFGLWSIGLEDGQRAGNEVFLGFGTAGRVTPIRITEAGTLYYVPEQRAGFGVDIFVANLDAGGRVDGAPVRLLDARLDSNQFPAWSPDGQHVAYVRAPQELESDGSGLWDVVVHSLTTRTERSSPVRAYGMSPPVWLDDGSGLLFLRQYWHYESGVRRSLDSIAHTTLPGPSRAVAVSADDKTLYLFVADRNRTRQHILAIDLNTGEDRIVSTLAGWHAGSSSARMVMSPDGTSLVATLEAAGLPGTRLLQVPLDGSPPRVLFADVVAGTALWMPDGRSVLVVRGDDQQLVRVAVDDGSVTPVGLKVTGGSLDLSRDGSRLLFTQRTRSAEVLLAYEHVASLLK